MKIYISFDIEGVSGVADYCDIDESSPYYEDTRKRSTEDVNASVEGAMAAGATDVVVIDAHGRGRRNLIYENLHKEAKLVKNRATTPGFNMAAFDASYDAMFFIGWHSRPQAPGVLSHCFNPSVFSAWRVNGKPVGEPELAAALGGYHNVPLVLFTGDDKSCEEVSRWAPECITVETKQAIDRYSAICLSRQHTYEQIYEGAKLAMSRIGDIPAFTFDMPVKIEVDVLFDHNANVISLIPGVDKVSDLTVAFQSDDYSEAYRTIHAIAQMARVSE